MRSPRAHAPGAVRGGIARDTPSVLFGGARRRRLRALLRLLPLAAVLVAGAVRALAGATSTSVSAAPADAIVVFAPPPPADDGQGFPPTPRPVIEWKRSRPMGVPWAGSLRRAVQLPAEGPDWFTWDGVLDQAPNRGWRRWGTAGLIRTTLAVLREYREANPGAARVGIGDISRQHGGHFGREFGGLGHASHQNGLDVDVWYPRVDGLERRPYKPSLVDEALAQDLVDRFVDAGAEHVFVGPHLHLTGPRVVVSPLVHHDDHLHVRIPPPPA